jgi:hypothetical protein
VLITGKEEEDEAMISLENERLWYHVKTMAQNGAFASARASCYMVNKRFTTKVDLENPGCQQLRLDGLYLLIFKSAYLFASNYQDSLTTEHLCNADYIRTHIRDRHCYYII